MSYGEGDKTIGVIVILVVLFAVFAGGWGGIGGRGHAVAYDGGCGCGCKEPKYSATDRDLWIGQLGNCKELAAMTAQNTAQFQALGDKITENTISELRSNETKAYIDNAANLAKIESLQAQLATNAQFSSIKADLCALGYALERKPNTPPYLLPGKFMGCDPCGSCC